MLAQGGDDFGQCMHDEGLAAAVGDGIDHQRQGEHMIEVGMSQVVFWEEAVSYITTEDVVQGQVKSIVFGLIVALVGIANGFTVTGGAEGVGRATTRAVVLSISYLVIADMLFTYFLNR